ncbi:YchJ family metal-binding protein [Actinoplanes sp. NPDC023936]|uniref:YchJ family protein n=1 Tax=Actinoplanes sp. NPDC023936 TaxID=3154910 RepID=UPI0033DCFC82
MAKRRVSPSVCPCGNTSYPRCCGPLHDGKPAADPEALMRSRFSAYALGRTDYVVRTWHPETRPSDPAELADDPGLRWVRLEVLGTSGGGMFDAEGTVEFRAHYREGGKPGVMQEKSRFVRSEGQWVYWGPLPL